MTAKEKAEELVNRMYNVDSTDDYDEISMQYGHAKICALIAVDEILIALEGNHWQNRLMMDYYEEIKQEIEKL
jgi:hypothetical protein